jgi:cell division protein FtsW
VALFGLLVYAGVRIALGAKDRFGALLAGGLTSLVVVQAIMNMAAVTGMMPVTGIPLPLVSAGGSSLMLTMGCLGVVLSVSANGLRAERARPVPERREESTGAGAAERRGDGRPHLSGIDGGRATVRRRA